MPALLHDPDFGPFLTDNHAPSPSLADAIAFALQKYPGFNFLPSNNDSIETHCRNVSPATAHFSCDNFRMYEFKVRRCMRGRSHDWTECPFAHPGEKARRRDPRRIHYSGAPCPDFRKGSCRRGDACEFAHGVFECWLHPARYRTQVCKDGKNCKRRVCFFAHSAEQLRVLPSSPSSGNGHTEIADGSPSGLPGSFLSEQRSFSLENASSGMGSPSKTLVSDMIGASSTFTPSAERNCIKQFPSAGALSSSSFVPSSAFMFHPTHQVSPLPVNMEALNYASPLRQAVSQSFPSCKTYGGGSFNLSVGCASATEYPSIFDGYSPGCASLHLRHGNCNGKLQEGRFLNVSLPLGSLEKSHRHELASHSHGFASPTSTLAGHTFSPPPLSPPLSPSSSPNPASLQNEGAFINPGPSFYNFFGDDTVSSSRGIKEPTHSYTTKCMEDLNFRLQQLKVPETVQRVKFSLQNLNEHRHGMLESMSFKLSRSCLEDATHGLSCTPKPSLWTSSNESSPKDYGCNLSELSDSPAQEIATKLYGEESFADNLIPDFGWVSELVK